MNKASPRDYSFIAPMYDRIFFKPLSEGHQKIGGLMKRSRLKSRTIKVLEVGVGSGLTISHVPTSVDFTGIDVNQKMLEIATEKAKRMKSRKINLEIMDAERMRFAANSFDLVMAPSVLSAMDRPMQGLKEIIRVTKKGGKIAVIANLRKKNSMKSNLVKVFDPLTRKYLGFRLDLSLEDFQQFKNLKLVEMKEVNNFFGQSLSTYLLFEKF
mgnify:FL=1